MSDVMMFNQNGIVTTKGWTFHNAFKSLPPRNTTSRPSKITANASVISAIKDTVKYHEQNRALKKVGLTPDGWNDLFHALIKAESAFNPNAKSPVGAYGLGQLMPQTAKELGVDRYDMAQNLDGAARYFLAQLDRFERIDYALAAYNAGPHRVVQYGGIPPFSETRAYIKRINTFSNGLVLSSPSVRG